VNPPDCEVELWGVYDVLKFKGKITIKISPAVPSTSTFPSCSQMSGVRLHDTTQVCCPSSEQLQKRQSPSGHEVGSGKNRSMHQ